MTETSTKRNPTDLTHGSTRHDDICQVILHNDDVNSAEHVVLCLIRIFGHTQHIAVPIMIEAHEHGRAIAEVEEETPAKLHRDQLQSSGLSATVEKL